MAFLQEEGWKSRKWVTLCKTHDYPVVRVGVYGGGDADMRRGGLLDAGWIAL